MKLTVLVLMDFQVSYGCINYSTLIAKKVIPENIGELLTPLALAVWIMDDGTWKQPGVRIATNCFTKEECELLVSVLDLKFNLKCSLHKNNNNYQIYIKQESISSLRKLVIPHMVPSMLTS